MATKIPSTFYIQYSDSDRTWQGSSDGRDWSSIDNWIVNKSGSYTLMLSTTSKTMIFARINPAGDNSGSASGVKMTSGIVVPLTLTIDTSLELVANQLISSDPKIQLGTAGSLTTGTVSTQWNGARWTYTDSQGAAAPMPDPFILAPASDGTFSVLITDNSTSPSYPHYSGLYFGDTREEDPHQGTIFSYDEVDCTGTTNCHDGNQQDSSEGTFTLNVFQPLGSGTLLYKWG